MALDDVDTDGYVLEPIGYLKWTNADVDTTVITDPTQWSTIIADDPNNLYIPAGWTVVSFGTNDRGTVNPKTTAYILSLPKAMIDPAVDPMYMTYTDQPGWFNGLTALDDDAVTPGVNVVVDYNASFDLPNTIVAQWRNMFDDVSDEVINSVDNLDYSVEIYQDEALLETIDFTWDEGTTAYIASAAQTAVDSSAFGSLYEAVYIVETPSGDVFESSIDIVVGVMPPSFAGIEDRYSDEGVFIDLMEGITADDGYGNDLTDTIEVTVPGNLNIYYPQPGQYEIGLEFTHHIHFDGVDPFIDLAGSIFTFDGSLNIVSADWDSVIAVYTEVANLQATTMRWGSSGVIIEVAGDGTVMRTIDRHNWDLVDENGLNTPANAQAMFDAWLAGLTLQENGFIIIVGYNMGAAYTAAKALAFGDAIAYDLTEVEVFDYDIITSDSYTLTIDDTTNPYALVVNDSYRIDQNEFDNVNEAILANVVAFDNFDPVDDLAIYVSDNGGLMLNTPGVYTVEVTVEDMAGNTAVAEFDVEVVAVVPALTAEEIQDMIDAGGFLTAEEIQEMFDDQTLTAAEIQALLDAQVLTAAEIQAMIDAQEVLSEEDVQALIDASLPEETVETGCGAASASMLNLGILGLFTLLGTAYFVFRRHN